MSASRADCVMLGLVPSVKDPLTILHCRFQRSCMSAVAACAAAVWPARPS